MANDLVPMKNQPPELRRGILARIFGAIDHQIEVDKMRSEYELAKMFITLDTQLRRQRRQAALYLEADRLGRPGRSKKSSRRKSWRKCASR